VLQAFKLATLTTDEIPQIAEENAPETLDEKALVEELREKLRFANETIS